MHTISLTLEVFGLFQLTVLILQPTTTLLLSLTSLLTLFLDAAGSCFQQNISNKPTVHYLQPNIAFDLL